MKTKFLSFIITCLIVSNVFSQTKLNNYKYVIVPSKYEFLKDKDKYQLNSLTKFLFNKYGFEAFMEGESFPDELNRNRCLVLNSDVTEDSAMFKTKLSIVLKDCNGEVVYTTKMGETREKDFTKSYALALRDAFEDIIALNHVYKPDGNAVVAVSNVPMNQNADVVKEIQQLKEELETLKKEKEVVEVVEVKKTITEPVNVAVTGNIEKVSSSILYAQQIENGFQLVDSSPKVVYKIKNTSLENVFMVEGKNATLLKKGDNWIMEYYENDVLKQEVLNIKF